MVGNVVLVRALVNVQRANVHWDGHGTPEINARYICNRMYFQPKFFVTIFRIAFAALLKSGVEISLLGLRMQFCITQEVSWDKMILSISTARKRRGYYTLKRRNSDQWWKSEEIFQGQLGSNVEHIFPKGAYSWPGWFFTVQHDNGSTQDNGVHFLLARSAQFSNCNVSPALLL